MIRVGLTGGLASGKSFVGSILADLGCRVIRADEIGHQLLQPGTDVYRRVVDTFGSGILDNEGLIVRKKLAAEVFGDSSRLATLNSIVHPAVFGREEQFMAEVAADEPDGIAVVEAAILIETGSYRRYDQVVLVVCTEEQQIQRAMERDGCTREEAEARLRRQMPLAEKRKYAHHVIDTSGDKSSTIEQTRSVYQVLRSGRK